MTNNSADIAPLVIAALCLACPITAQPVFSSKAECLYFLNVVKPNHIFCDPEFYVILKECLGSLNNDAKIFTFGGQTDESIPVDILFEKADIEPEFV